MTASKLCRQLKAAYPQYDFVPVYWMATEDHDFAEINHFQLFGKTYAWDAADVGGPVGRLKLAGLAEQVLDQLPADVPTAFRDAYRQAADLTTRRLTHALFGAYGLLSLDADTPALKQALVPVLEQEIRAQASHRAVQATDAALEAAGYAPQVYSRPLNLFFLTDDGRRERLEADDRGNVAVLNTDLRYDEAALLDLARREPARFSPNVVLRPLYQEILLPDLCYIGGGGGGGLLVSAQADFRR